MPPLARITDAFQAALQLGINPVRLYASYRLLLRTGILRLQTRNTLRWSRLQPASRTPEPLLELPERDRLRKIAGEDGLSDLKEEAGEILSGKIRLFGADPVPLHLSISAPLRHWTEYELGRADPFEGQTIPIKDIKFIWEPARFGWAFTLGRAYWLLQDERYPEAFWRFFEEFQAFNPAYLGSNWMSAQEVALRLIALVFAAQVFASSQYSTPARITSLGTAIAEHAARIPPTISYARSQNNNHLLTEAAGLITAGLALPGLREAQRWRDLGWKHFQRGLQSQISPQGVYIQHSTNYQRLMLQIALWVHALARIDGQKKPQPGNMRFEFPPLSRDRLAAATRWLLALVDQENGRVPNLGPNDGAYILPLSGTPFHDYRPTLQAAAQAWLGGKVFAPGTWDEMGEWVGGEKGRSVDWEMGRLGDRKSGWVEGWKDAEYSSQEPAVIRSPRGASWAYFRAAKFTSRPGHADQLHLDLWWRGLNIAQDAGTYLYNAPAPWENALACTAIHNTMIVDELDQMRPAGKFLWLDWAQAKAMPGERAADGSWERRIAQHNGYLSLGVIHERAVTAYEFDRWTIEDRLLAATNPQPQVIHTARLHWLLPDWSWELVEDGAGAFQLRLQSPYGWVYLRIQSLAGSNPPLVENQIVRAGENLIGKRPASPTWGWVSPTYGVKAPALSIIKVLSGALPLTLSSEWQFPK